MSDYVKVPRFTCDLCDEVVAGQEPYPCALSIGNHLREFHICTKCYVPVEKSQNHSIFKKAWNKFFGKEDKTKTLFEKIKHGDTDHQAWLYAAIEDHFGR